MAPHRSAFLTGTAAAGLTLAAGCGSRTASNVVPAAQLDAVAARQAWSAGPLPAGSLSVTVGSQSNGAIAAPGYVGLSFEKQVVGLGTFDARNADLVGLFRRLGPSVLRIGGSTVDTDRWDPYGPGRVLGKTSRRDVKRLAGFLAATGWVAAYGIRYKDTHADTVTDEAVAAASLLGASLANFEIGNEPDGYTSEPIFETTWESYRRAILAQLPSASFMAPETASADRFFRAFAGATAGQIAILSAHHYTGSADDPRSTVHKLLHSTERGFLSAMQQTWRPSQDPAYRIGETNSLYGGGKDGVSNSFASALWATRYLLDGAQYGGAGFNFHGGTSTEFGHELYYSPIRFAGTTGTKVIGVQPEYYGLLLVTLAGAGTSYVTSVTGSPMVVAYAIGKNVVLVNLADTAFEATVTMPAALSSARSLLLRTRCGARATHGQTLGGSAVALDGTFAPAYVTLPVNGQNFTTPVPAISATLIETA